jgi:hypothetical protein
VVARMRQLTGFPVSPTDKGPNSAVPSADDPSMVANQRNPRAPEILANLGSQLVLQGPIRHAPCGRRSFPSTTPSLHGLPHGPVLS